MYIYSHWILIDIPIVAVFQESSPDEVFHRFAALKEWLSWTFRILFSKMYSTWYRYDRIRIRNTCIPRSEMGWFWTAFSNLFKPVDIDMVFVYVAVQSVRNLYL
jgi:hypothetical protein